MSESMFVAVTVYASDYKVIIVLDNDLYVWHQAITWTITDLLSTTPLRIIVNWISIKLQRVSFNEIDF